MCGNSRQRVIHIPTAVAVIFFRLQVACAVNGGCWGLSGHFVSGDVRTANSHLWTAPCWQGISARCCSAGRCCHLFGLFVRRSQMAAGHNALRRSGPGQKHAVSKLHWLRWGVLISGSTGWVHYPSLALSNLVSASEGPRVFQAACCIGSL